MTQAFEDMKARRPKPTLPMRERRGPIELLFLDMQSHDMKGNTWTRNAIGAYLARRARLTIDTTDSS